MLAICLKDAVSQEVNINKSTVDFDYLPKLANPTFFYDIRPRAELSLGDGQPLY
ncbi:hypothetical protein ROBYS_38480 [Roseobacter sp. OBYS 0001]|nr:hypothetical protein ROBYS_38480 [Roseobacter sp. OBYS 0001]